MPNPSSPQIHASDGSDGSDGRRTVIALASAALISVVVLALVAIFDVK